MSPKFDPNKHHRRSIRLKGHDYHSLGAYFVTICTRDRECVLDDPVVNGIIVDVWRALPQWFPTIVLDEFVVMPNHIHLIVWLQAADIKELDDVSGIGASGIGASPTPTGGVGDDVGRITLAVTPNTDPDETEASPASTWVIPSPERTNPTPALGDVIGAFKSLVFTVYLDWIQAHGPTRRAKFWQRNYYEHIIRNEREIQAIRRYIRKNPAQWTLDRDNPDNFRRSPSLTKVEDYLWDVLALMNDD